MRAAARREVRQRAVDQAQMLSLPRAFAAASTETPDDINLVMVRPAFRPALMLLPGGMTTCEILQKNSHIRVIEPTSDTARLEFGLVGHIVLRGSLEPPKGGCPLRNVTLTRATCWCPNSM